MHENYNQYLKFCHVMSCFGLCYFNYIMCAKKLININNSNYPCPGLELFSQFTF